MSPPAVAQPEQDLVLLDPTALRFRRIGSRLEVRRGERDPWQEVRPVRLFPLSQSESWLSFLDKDSKEIGLLQEMDKLPAEELRLLREELARRYLIPTILRILACRDRYDMVEWTVETDRGRATFVTRGLRDKVQEPLPRHLTLTDVQGNRYDIPDIGELDPDSRRRLEERV